MTKITTIRNKAELELFLPQEQLAQWLHINLDQFTDAVPAISKAVDYAFSGEPGKGGFLLLAHEEKELAGALVMNATGMAGYVPEYLLVYIAVGPEHRGQGIGGKLIQRALELCQGEVALHVEYDNPASRLYKRMGFTSKYAEMRWTREA
ncbi:MAG: GNAT family N-acetyltransferase [Candidatus Cloacimonetes bacterium]|jgi:GNAT superfamily N-acetyltransferase|nr:GNAT family N-acetyltransferase [Candidatus Cloacimonadota bacterium]MDY0367755.1 GNAT family N-acetyltransferase [Candidatus Syntrophosphaera sp.]HOY85652.1 GNAT family N-acetyltransferase [Candidatus Syntrophosphaera sp.]HPH61096.1 GNAT family N-acetyltransferase [Candidatus Syntrophosphaera sp.]